MKDMLCTRCKKRMAILFMTHMEGSKTINEGLCFTCAKELNIPQIKSLIDKFEIDEEEMNSVSDQIMDMMDEDMMEDDDENFEVGGAQPMPFVQSFFGDSSLPAVPDESANSRNKNDKSEKKQEKRKKSKYIDNYCENLTEKARRGELDAIIGRDREIYRVTQILNRRTKNNPCLIGEPGVGKTAIAEGIAIRLASGDIPPRLADKELYLLDLTALVAGTQFRGQFESRVKGLINEIKEVGNVILFIDEIHSLVGAGDTDGSMNAANILKPALSRGEVQVIGATTFNEYRKYIEKDSALERRFQPVRVDEPTIEETIEVLRGIKHYYAEYHNVSVSDEIIINASNLSERYITDRFLPDKAIDLLDEACSCAVLGNKHLAEYDNLKKLVTRKNDEIDTVQTANADIDYEKIASIRGEIFLHDERLKELEPLACNIAVTLEDVAKVVELWTGIPASKIQENDLKKVAHLEENLKKKIIGQDEAVGVVASAVRRSRIQISGRRRPASFIFVGPTGVGKTELVKVLADEMFDATDPLIRLDMSEFMEKHAVSRILGSPPGYVGYDEAGQLTEKVRRKPYSVVLFDEIEKAHPDVMNILLQILDEGKITDAHGRTVSFANTVIVMTSNAGSERKDSNVGFNKTGEQVAKDRAYKSLNEFLRPEFIARVDEIVVFRLLSKEDFEKIAALMLDELKAPLAERSIKFDFDSNALSVIAQKAYGKKNGARDIRNVIRKEVEDEICKIIINDESPSIMKLTGDDSALKIHSL